MSYGKTEYPKVEAIGGERVPCTLFFIGANERGYGQIVLKQENGSFVNTSLYEPKLPNNYEELSDEDKANADIQLNKDQKNLLYRLADFLCVTANQNDEAEYKAVRLAIIKRFQNECESYADVLTLAEQMFKDEDYTTIPLICTIVFNTKGFAQLPRFGACVEKADFEGTSKLETKMRPDGTPYNQYERNVEVEA